MSFLKICDPAKRNQMVEEYLNLKKNIRDNLLSERTGEQQLQTDLSKLYRPITETQKDTAREITEGLKPIKEGIENLPQAITFPPMQPIGEASGEASGKEKPLDLGYIANVYLNRSDKDTKFGIREEGGLYYIGNKKVTIVDNNILIDGEVFKGTPCLWELITYKDTPDLSKITGKEFEDYFKILIKSSTLHHNNDPNNTHPKSSSGDKWKNLLSNIWFRQKAQEERHKAWGERYRCYSE